MYDIYGLKEHGSELIRYVGITSRTIKQRVKEHLWDRKINHKTNWIRSISENIEFVLIESGITTLEEANAKEINYIKMFKACGANLVNTTAGGDGFKIRKHSPETIEKIKAKRALQIISDVTKFRMGLARKGLKRTAEARERFSKSKMGKLNPMYGKFGKLNPTAKAITQFDMKGNFIKDWDSAADALRFYGNIHISCCLSGKRNHAGGFIWKFST
jgi:hypothetical protein